jgi:hypothetical protein
MADTSRPSKEELLQIALDAVPATGEMSYRDWYDGLVNSGNHAAVNFYRELKARGLVTSRVVAAEDGSITHTIGRAR